MPVNSKYMLISESLVTCIKQSNVDSTLLFKMIELIISKALMTSVVFQCHRKAEYKEPEKESGGIFSYL